MSQLPVPVNDEWFPPLAPGSHAACLDGTDGWCVAYWLQARASGSANTRLTYVREAGRWLAFLATIAPEGADHQRLLASATYDSVARFIAWIEDKDGLSKDLPQWAADRYRVRPGKPKASPAVLKMAVIVLHGLYDELLAAVAGEPPRPPVSFNPFKPYRRQYREKSSRARRTLQAPGVAKALSDDGWALLWQVASEPVAGPVRMQRLQARRRLELAMLRATWERRSAVAGLTWADLQKGREGGWYVQRMRKGDGLVWDPVPPQVWEEIDAFRRACNLPMEPGEAERERSIFYIGIGGAGSQGPISDDTLYRDVKILFDLAAVRAEAAGASELAEEMRRTGRGPHTIRHTMATMFMASGGAARDAQEILGHASIATTTRVYDNRTDEGKVGALQRQWELSRGPSTVNT